MSIHQKTLKWNALYFGMKLHIIGLILSIVFHLNSGAQTIILSGISASDHQRKEPLKEALNYQMIGVSIDLEMNKEKELRCGKHDFEQTYLMPLYELAERQKGWVYEGITEEFWIFIKIKSDSASTWNVLDVLLTKYAGMLSSFDKEKKFKRAVRIVLSGNVMHESISQQAPRFVMIDEPINALQKERSPIIATSTINFSKVYDWKGDQNMPNMQYHSLVTYVKNAHKASRIVRIQRAPEKSNAFGILLGAGADLIEVNDLMEYSKFYRNRKPY